MSNIADLNGALINLRNEIDDMPDSDVKDRLTFSAKMAYQALGDYLDELKATPESYVDSEGFIRTR